MRSVRLIGLAIALSGLFGGCASSRPRPEAGPPSAAETESERADLLRELSLYSD